MKTNVLSIPFISYQGRYVSVYGTIATARYSLDEKNTTGLITKLGMQTFKPEDPSNTSMNLLDERMRLIYLGPYYRFKNDYGQLTALSLFDVTDRSNGGLELGGSYSYLIHFNNRQM